MENTTAAGSNDLAPNRTRLSRVSKERMAPIAPPAMATSGNDFEPISSIWRASSRNSKGGVTAARRTFQEKMPSSPNHSKNPLNIPVLEFEFVDMDEANRWRALMTYSNVFCRQRLRTVLKPDVGCGGTHTHSIFAVVEQRDQCLPELWKRMERNQMSGCRAH